MFSEALLMDTLSRFVLPLARISAFLMVLPLIGSKTLPTRIRAAFAFLITLLCMQTIPQIPPINWVGVEGVIQILQQMIIGAIMGFAVQILFQIFVITGQLIAMQNGLGFATFIDPVSGVNVATIGQFYLVAANLLFLVMDGHLTVIEVLVNSFDVYPITTLSIPYQGMEELILFTSWMFASALVVALPAVIAVLISNFAFGVLSRIAPQMNIFVVGFPFNMIFGVVVLYISFASFGSQFEDLALHTFNFMNHILR